MWVRSCPTIDKLCITIWKLTLKNLIEIRRAYIDREQQLSCYLMRWTKLKSFYAKTARKFCRTNVFGAESCSKTVCAWLNSWLNKSLMVFRKQQTLKRRHTNTFYSLIKMKFLWAVFEGIWISKLPLNKNVLSHKIIFLMKVFWIFKTKMIHGEYYFGFMEWKASHVRFTISCSWISQIVMKFPSNNR